jgi:hypothetical protein
MGSDRATFSTPGLPSCARKHACEHPRIRGQRASLSKSMPDFKRRGCRPARGQQPFRLRR